MSEHIPMSEWGKDHWSTLAYIETRIVDFKGVPDKRHMRCDNRLHPAFAHLETDKEYPTRLRGGVERHGHDDWSCIDDAIAEGLLEWHGTGVHPLFALTPKGLTVAGALRRHKASGGNFGEFAYEVSP
jgi:hypothetical protein